MHTVRNLLSICLGALAAVLIGTVPVQAASVIVYVSAAGSDSNVCTLAAPCRTVQHAIDLVAAGGVVRALDSASYGNANITKSLTIDGGGNIVGLGTKITINSASATVTLRGLVMDGRGLGSFVDGITISAAAAVHVEDCEIASYTGDGIQLAGSAATELFVTGTIVRETNIGVYVPNSSALVTVEDSRFENNGAGLHLNTANASVTRSITSGSNFGIYIDGGTVNITETTAADNSRGFRVVGSGVAILSSSVARGGDIGLSIAAGSTAIISDSVFTSNDDGIYNEGTLYTRKNNTNNWNVTDYDQIGAGTKISTPAF